MTSLHTGIIQVKQTQLLTKDMSISGRIHVEPLNKHLVVRILLRPSNWLALCTSRLCIEPRMKMGTKTSRRTWITQVKQNQLITKDIFIIDRIRGEILNKHLVVISILRPFDVSTWLALCTSRLCIEPLMKMSAKTSRHTGIIQVKQAHSITKDNVRTTGDEP